MYRELDEHWKEFDIPEATKMWRRLLRVSLKRMTKAERFEEAKLFLDGRAQAFLDVRVNAGKDEPGVRYDLAKEYMLLANVSRNKETGLDIEDLESLSLGQLEAAASAGFANPKRLSREKVWEPLRNDERFALIKNSLPPKK